MLPVLLPASLFVATGIGGIDFGRHWDEERMHVAPVRRTIETGTALPGLYLYPSITYWMNLSALLPDLVGVVTSEALHGSGRRERIQERLIAALEAPGHRLRTRTLFLLVSALSAVWVYLTVWVWQRSRLEALLAASLLCFSWEVAYHSRWLAPDAILMQLGALTALLTLLAHWNPARRIWLRLAAASAGLCLGTKYPGGLFVVPVLLTAATACRDRSDPPIALLRSAGGVLLWFAVAYLVTTPGTLLQPFSFALAILAELQHYGVEGKGGYTIGRGLDHGWQILQYLSLSAVSPYAPISLGAFALALAGARDIAVRSPRTALVFLCLPVLYLAYFSQQVIMIVRNLLLVMPFLAILAARGTMVLSRAVDTRGWRPAVLVIAFLTLAIDALWLVRAAESIAARSPERVVREAAAWVSANDRERIFLSPRVRSELGEVLDLAGPGPIQDEAAGATVVLLYPEEGFEDFRDWPANDRSLTLATLGPHEVDFNYYPTWGAEKSGRWTNERILVVSAAKARRYGVLGIE
jgi:4-amino-4-deoxy-L-arabinose transferase-like glycosyltransferase